LFAAKVGEEGISKGKGEKRKQQVEAAMMKQARVKINPANFKMSVSAPFSAVIGNIGPSGSSIPVLVRRKVDVEQPSINTDSTTAAISDGKDEPLPFRNALSMLADY
jgi:hypothetical protein